MVEIGSTIQAKVERIDSYGVWMKHKGEVVLVLIPEICWVPLRHPGEKMQEGEILEVYVLRYNYCDKVIVGSIRRLHPEDNPYRKLSRLEPGTILLGTVESLAGEEIRIWLVNHAWGNIPKHRIKEELRIGDRVEVLISALDVDEGRLALDYVQRAGTSPPAAHIPTSIPAPV